mmetsp:Transcript_15585/g.39815  ORF Transcript_15585/g.39815 Transcript_15585/m.39815 type:complete len:215 (+) Transcript_15585:752-1396(+)
MDITRGRPASGSGGTLPVCGRRADCAFLSRADRPGVDRTALGACVAACGRGSVALAAGFRGLDDVSTGGAGPLAGGGISRGGTAAATNAPAADVAPADVTFDDMAPADVAEWSPSFSTLVPSAGGGGNASFAPASASTAGSLAVRFSGIGASFTAPSSKRLLAALPRSSNTGSDSNFTRLQIDAHCSCRVSWPCVILQNSTSNSLCLCDRMSRR